VAEALGRVVAAAEEEEAAPLDGLRLSCGRHAGRDRREAPRREHCGPNVLELAGGTDTAVNSRS
jgi:hypothetical protein